MKRVHVFAVILAVIAFAAAGCSREQAVKHGEAGKAIAVLQPTQGSKVQGTVSFAKDGDKVHVVALVQGLTPGPHGFHIHEYGDCSSPDAGSAGGHFNPTGAPHGAPTADRHHAGDFGNIEADASGVARLDLLSPGIKFDGPESILGRAVIVHAEADDLKTQPTGASGARVACGVIGFAK